MEKYGRLQILRIIKPPKGRTKALCLCDCGNEVIVLMNNLKSGRTKSCGCWRRERMPKAQKVSVDKKRSVGPAQENSVTGVRGVSWHRQSGKWQANIQVKKVKYFLGLFDTIEEAAAARKKAEDELQ